MSHQDASKKSIIFAFSANLGIAMTKSIAAALTGSGALLAESIHSFADCGNQGLLFLGLRTSKKQPDTNHPLGYGMSIFFWSFIVALMLFSMGGLFSIYEGFHKLHSNETINNPIIAILVLSVSIILEGASLWGCITQVNKIKNRETLWRWIKNTRQSELVVVLGEDIAALLGLLVALFAVILSSATKNPMYDALGSIGIGIILIAVSILIAIKIKGLLIGQSADETLEGNIRHFITERPEVCSIYKLITIQLGQQVMLSVKAEMASCNSSYELIENINNCEKAIRSNFPTIQWIFFEPDNKD